MNKLEETLATILEKALNLAEQTGEFVMEQAPELLQQFYSWHIATNIMGISLFIITLIPFIIFYKKAKWNYTDTINEVMTIVFGSCSFFTLIMAMICIYDLTFILVAPELYLIEYFIK